MRHSLVRTVIVGVALSVFVLAWGGVFAAKFFSDSMAVLTAAVTAAAFATEGLIWVLAIVLGLSLFASRRRLWDRMTRR